MKVKFILKEKSRKELVEAVANYTGQKAEYLYTPTYAYKIGNYTIDKEGDLLSDKSISLAFKEVKK